MGIIKRNVLFAAVLLLLFHRPVLANTILSTTGTFAVDDAEQSFNFTLASAATVTMRTWSFGGGTNANGSVITTGGFAPVLSLFNASGSQPLLAFDTGGTAPLACGPRNIDPVTGFCLDAYLNDFLSAGSYILVLTQFDNTPNGPNLSDGFFEQGNGNFTGGPFFLNAGTGFQRTGDWAVDITTAPEPSTAALLIPILTLFVIAHAVRTRRV